MKVEILYVSDCPHYRKVLDIVQEILAETAIEAHVELLPVESLEEARRLQFIGSPTVRVNGLDVEPHTTFSAKEFGLACRIYSEDGERQFWPSRRVIKDAIEVGRLAELDLLPACC